MAERKSQNKYYPPDWDPSKGSVNKYVGQHPLRDRAKKISQGILVIRFEMPYNIWCEGCNSHIGMGVRYNAEKKKVGNYYSTPIWQFRMKCHLCDNYFEIKTDPQNHDYVITSGARRKEQRWDPKENEQIATEDKAIQKKMATDAMFKLEHGSDDVKKSTTKQMTLSQLQNRRSEYNDDYILNKLARNKFREEKKALKKTEIEDKDLLQRSSLDIKLVPETDEDKHLAGLLKYKAVETYDEKQQQKREEILNRPIFQKTVDTEKNKDNLRKSLTQNQKSVFDNETFDYKCILQSQKLLGIRKKNLKNKNSGNLSIKPCSSEKEKNFNSGEIEDKLKPEIVLSDHATKTSDNSMCVDDSVSNCSVKIYPTSFDSCTFKSPVSSSVFRSSSPKNVTNMDSSVESSDDFSSPVAKLFNIEGNSTLESSINSSSLSLVSAYSNSDSDSDNI